MLEVARLAVSYGHHQALKGVDLHVAPGEIVVILGANGAGKTSLLKAVAGMIPCDAGSRISMDGRPLAGQPPHRIVETGLALVPEGRGVFGDLSVGENLALGGFARRARDHADANLGRVQALFPRLAERSAQLVRTMSGGEQQMVAVGRALMSAPTILMLDEPSLGLSPLLCSELFRKLAAIRDSGVGILLVEQNARQSLAIADRAYLLENGAIVGQGPALQLARDPAVQAAYLGGAASHAPPKSAPMQAPAAADSSAALAQQALAAFAQSRDAGRQSAAPADSMLPASVADLVRIATRRQAEEVLARRAAAGSGGPAQYPGTVAAGDTLAQALAGITGAAAQARAGALAPTPPSPAASAAVTAAPNDRAHAAAIEIWRRPGVEIHRRHADGRLHREN